MPIEKSHDSTSLSDSIPGVSTAALLKILENLPVALFAKNVQDNNRFILWNKRAEELFSLPRDIVIGSTDHALYPKEQADFFYQTDARVMASREVVVIDEEPITSAGRTWTAHTVKVPVYDDHGVPSILFGLVEDITAQKELVAQVEATHAAEKATLAKSEFLANMSHELRTPLNSLLGMAVLLSMTSLDSRQNEMLGIMLQAGELLQHTINDILDLSKIEAQQVTLERIGFDPQAVFNQTISVMQPLASKKGLLLTLDWPQGSMPAVSGDPARFARILHNLIGNAIKYTPSGQVRVSARWEKQADGAIVLSARVTDTGIGIAREKQGLIFHKFSQGDSSTTRKYGGTGLGLTITQELVGLMQGTIGVESVVGEGSTFWFTVPFEIAQIIDKEWAETTASVSGALLPLHRLHPEKTRILVAEDNALNQLYMDKLLSAYGFAEVRFVENGVEAVSAFTDADYDLIFMDCHMPEMNGYEATQNIRRLEESSGGRIPIIAMTANALLGEREKCLAIGMDEYVSKPIDISLFRRVLGNWVVLPDIQRLTQQTADAGPPPIDMAEIRFYSDGNIDKERKLVGIFEKQTVAVLATLRENCVDGENVPWREAAHLLKGSAGSIGAAQLRMLCADAQEAGPETAGWRRNLLADIEHEIGRILRYFSGLNLTSKPYA